MLPCFIAWRTCHRINSPEASTFEGPDRVFGGYSAILEPVNHWIGDPEHFGPNRPDLTRVRRAKASVDAKPNKSDYLCRRSHTRISSLLPQEPLNMGRTQHSARKFSSALRTLLAKTLGAILITLFSACAAISANATDDEKPLRVYFIDVEGGQATLFVTPDGQSLLIDTGWPDNDGRDADRIVAVAKKAGLARINYVLITHYHSDHVGGLPQLVARIPVDTFIDHGDNRETGVASTIQNWTAYQELLATQKFKHITVKPGDILPVLRMHATVVSSDGALIQSPLPGAGYPNPACKESKKQPVDQTENARSLGIFIAFGNLKILDLGDLTWEKEMQLMCPANKLGKVDIYIVSHHGSQQSGSPALVYGVEPRVAIMDNGAKKGGSPSAWEIIKHSAHLEDVWQLHFSIEGGKDHNAADEYIANPDGPDAADYLQLNGNSDGSFTVVNSRTQKTKRYSTR
jgi:competence protein ComEC